MSLGKNLKYQREKRGWSQLFVGEKIGITNTVLSNYERDYRDPDTDTLKKLADLYETTTDHLLGREDIHIPEDTILSEIDPELARKFIQAMNDPLEELFFDDILSASKEEREELIREFLKMRKEKKRK